MKTTYLKGILAASIFAIAHMAQAAPANMVTLGKTNPPIGHYEFCKTNPGMCGSMSDNGPLQLTEAKWKTLLKVNYTANTTIEPMTDQEIYGVEERWVLPTTVGDCEDYVLLKQKMLVQRGFSPSDLLIAVVLQATAMPSSWCAPTAAISCSTTCATRCCCGRIPNIPISSGNRPAMPASGSRSGTTGPPSSAASTDCRDAELTGPAFPAYPRPRPRPCCRSRLSRDRHFYGSADMARTRLSRMKP